MAAQVLVVDDDLKTAQAFAQLLTVKGGLEVEALSNVQSALELVRDHPIRVVVLDQRMPAMSGTELFSEMRKIKPALKAVMLSGEAGLSDLG